VRDRVGEVWQEEASGNRERLLLIIRMTDQAFVDGHRYRFYECVDLVTGDLFCIADSKRLPWEERGNLRWFASPQP
jgi:hypothetical protein